MKAALPRSGCYRFRPRIASRFWDENDKSCKIFLNYHLLLTDRCNLCCTYCRGRLSFGEPARSGGEIAIDLDLPTDFAIEPEDLYAFLHRDPRATLSFYGGEPLLRADLIGELVEHAPVRSFSLQTNGTLLDRLPREVLHRLDAISVSIDGPEAITDRYRGRGTYRTVMNNLRHIRKQGYPGELIARMTVSEHTDIEEAVLHLSSNPDHPFSSIHWQLDADFSDRTWWSDFPAWAEQRYNPGIGRLIGTWVDRMEEDGEIPRWYPFLVPVGDLLAGRKSHLRCGCGRTSYSIMMHGAIAPCPIMVGMKDQYVGHILRTDPKALPVTPVPDACAECTLRDLCGGRCLYSGVFGTWPESHRRIVCGTVHHLFEALRSALPRIRGLIEEGRVDSAGFDRPPYCGCEVIP